MPLNISTPRVSTAVWLDLSQPQHTAAGKLLGHMYYNRPRLLDSLSQEERSGYPHNGGVHSLSLHMTADDLLAFRAMVAEDFAGHQGLPELLADFDAKFQAKVGRPVPR